MCKREKHQLKCPDAFKFTCKLDKCSVDEKACKLFDFKKYETLHAKNLVMFQSNLVRYERFLKAIKKCPSEWQPDKICSNIAKCSLLKFNNSRKAFNKISKKCKCIGEQSFGCGRLCAADEKMCKAFNSEAGLNRQLYENLSICENGIIKIIKFPSSLI
jgi:hypothetical protein